MKKSVYWLLAIVITLVLSIYQRMTGPTHPKSVTIELDGETYKIKLPRSGVQKDEIVTLKGVPQNSNAQLHYRRYPTSDDYTIVDFAWQEGELHASLPVQPVAGKLQYYITVGGKDYLAEEPLLIRFRNDVPSTLNYDGMQQTLEFSQQLITRLANMPETPDYISVPSSNTMKHANFKVTLGLMPDVMGASRIPGLRADIVVAGKPAHEAGIRSGDIIQEIDGKPVKDINEYMERLSELEPDTTIPVKVLRGEKSMTFQVHLKPAKK